MSKLNHVDTPVTLGAPPLEGFRHAVKVQPPTVFIAYTGFSATLLWLGLFAEKCGSIASDGRLSAAVWVALGCVSLLAAIVALIRPRVVRAVEDRGRLVDVVSALLMAAVSALVCWIVHGAGLLVVSAIVCAAVVALPLLRWGSALARLDKSGALAVLSLDAVVLFLVKSLVAGLEQSGVDLIPWCLIVLPVLSCAGIYAVSSVPPEAIPGNDGGQGVAAIHYTRENLSSLVGLVVFMALFSVVLRLLDVIAPSGRGGLVSTLMALVVFGAVGLRLFVLRRPLDFFDDVRALLVATAVASVLCVGLDSVWYGVTAGVVLGIRELTRFYLFLLQADVARHCDQPAAAVFGVGWACCGLPRLPFLFFDDSAAWMQAWGGVEIVSLVAILLLLVLVMAYSMIKPPAGLRAPLSEPAPLENPDTTQRDVLAELAAEKGLTDREAEVFTLLCAGRNRSYIADTLYISENTVKFHTRNIYRKLGVSSKQEMLDLCEQVLPQSGSDGRSV